MCIRDSSRRPQEFKEAQKSPRTGLGRHTGNFLGEWEVKVDRILRYLYSQDHYLE